MGRDHNAVMNIFNAGSSAYTNREIVCHRGVIVELTRLELKGLNLAELIVSYSPESQFANETPTMYGMLFASARLVMEAYGIVPHENIRCWFWQIQLKRKDGDDKKAEKMIEQYSQMRSPHLNRFHSWEYPIGIRLSDKDFRRLFPN